jgi:ABC-type multidrug transport system fused ATPase/permease subunit
MIYNFFSVAGMFIIPFLVVLIPIIAGQYYGLYQSKNSATLKSDSISSAITAAFGLLAFMLALTFQIVANRYEARKGLLLDEVTNIRTTYLRAELIPEPMRSDTKNLLIEYTGLRVSLADKTKDLGFVMSHSEEILRLLWKNTEKLAEQDRSSEVYSLFTSSVNDLVDNYNQRITMTLEYRLPIEILWVLFIIAFLSMLAQGYQFGITGKGSLWVNLLLAVTFALVMFLILALDRPEKGLIRLEQGPIYTLQNQLNSWQSLSEM